MVMPDQVKKPVYKKLFEFGMEGHPVFSRLPFRLMEVDHNITEDIP